MLDADFMVPSPTPKLILNQKDWNIWPFKRNFYSLLWYCFELGIKVVPSTLKNQFEQSICPSVILQRQRPKSGWQLPCDGQQLLLLSHQSMTFTHLFWRFTIPSYFILSRLLEGAAALFTESSNSLIVRVNVEQRFSQIKKRHLCVIHVSFFIRNQLIRNQAAFFSENWEQIKKPLRLDFETNFFWNTVF